jgi:hypothetical protein
MMRPPILCGKREKKQIVDRYIIIIKFFYFFSRKFLSFFEKYHYPGLVFR